MRLQARYRSHRCVCHRKMRSLTYLPKNRISSPEKFWSAVEKDFCNRIPSRAVVTWTFRNRRYGPESDLNRVALTRQIHPRKRTFRNRAQVRRPVELPRQAAVGNRLGRGRVVSADNKILRGQSDEKSNSACSRYPHCVIIVWLCRTKGRVGILARRPDEGQRPTRGLGVFTRRSHEG